MAQEQEFVVRVRGSEAKKQFNVMRFNAALNMDVTKLKHCKMERENLFKEVKEEAEEELPEFGAGSEYGRKEREEARRRKYEKRKNKHNNSPWILKVGGKQGKKFKGIREGGVTENTSYYVFFQAPDGAFEAFPVNEWYNFTPFQRYKALSAEEAEEKFNKRDQILNYFPLKLMGKKEGEGSTDEPGKKSERSIKKDFKVSDIDDWYNSDNENLSDNDSEEEDKKPKIKGNLKKDKKGKRKKKSDSDEDDDEEPQEDSDEGDYDNKEVDYMSDSSSSSESDVEKGNIKGVEDESALRDVSEEEEEEEGKEENSEQTDETKPNEGEKKVKAKGEKNGNDEANSDSDFDSDNSDLDESKSALFIQNRKAQKAKSEQQSESTSNNAKSSGEGTSTEPNKNGSKSNGLKFKHKLDSTDSAHVNKKQRVEKVKSEPSDGITEEAVRRYLMRKPMTPADLLQKFKNKVHQRDKLVETIADILKRLHPENHKIKGKMYFSLKPK